MATQEEAIFCKIAVKNNLLTPEQCQECEQIRKQSGSEKGLIDVIIEKGYLSPKVVLAIFKAQAEVTAARPKRPVKEAKEGDSSLTLLEPGQEPAIPETQPTIQGEIVREDAPTPVLPVAPGPGDESYERLKREVTQMPFAKDGAKTAENVVYNINIKNFQTTETDRAAGEPPKAEDGALVPYTGGLTLRRDDLSEAQLLALLKGQAVNVPAKFDAASQIQAMQQAIAPMSMQHNILTAVRQNLLITILGLGIIAAMVVLGLIFIQGKNPPPIGPGATPAPSPMGLAELTSVLETGSPSMKKEAAKTIGQKIISGDITDPAGIDALVRGLNDSDPDVVAQCYFWLGKCKDGALRDNAYSSVFALFDRYADAKYKNKCLDLAADLQVSEKDMLNLLERSAKDAEAPVRGHTVVLISAYSSQRALEIARPLIDDPDNSVAGQAIAILWQKRTAVQGYDQIMVALNDPAITVPGLNRLISYIAQFKAPEYVGRIALYIAHPDRSVKICVFNTLAAYGPAAEAAFTEQSMPEFIKVRDALNTAQPPDLELRTTMVNALGAIHGSKSGELLRWYAENDPDPNLKAAADKLVATCPSEIVARHTEYINIEERRKIDAKKTAIKEVTDLLAAGNLAGAIPKLDALVADTDPYLDKALAEMEWKDRNGLNAKCQETKTLVAVAAKKDQIKPALDKLAANDLEGFYPLAEALITDQDPNLDKALAETDWKDRNGLNTAYQDARKKGGYVYVTDPQSLLPQPPPDPQKPPPPPPPKIWVKVDQAFDIINKGAEALAGPPTNDFPGALKLLKEMPPAVLAMEGMQQRLQVAIQNLQALAEGYAKSSVDIINDLMSKDNYPDADAKIKELEGKFTKDDFAEAYRRTSEERKKYVARFRDWRSQLMVLTGTETDEQILQKYGIPLRHEQNYGMPCIVVPESTQRTLRFDLDPGNKHNIVNITFAWTLAITPPRDCSDFQILKAHVDAPLASTVTIEVRCGAITYRKVFAPGDILMNLDDSTQVAGYGQKRQTIDAVTIRVAKQGNPREPSSPQVYIGGIFLTGQP